MFICLRLMLENIDVTARTNLNVTPPPADLIGLVSFYNIINNNQIALGTHFGNMISHLEGQMVNFTNYRNLISVNVIARTL